MVLLKTILSNNIPKENQIIIPVLEGTSETTTITSQIETDKIIKTILETGILPLVNSSNILVTKLGEYARDSSQHSILLQILFAVLNIVVTVAFVLYLVRKILKPIFALTNATSQAESGNLNVAVKSKGHDELSVLTESFNSMITSIKKYELKKNLKMQMKN